MLTAAFFVVRWHGVQLDDLKTIESEFARTKANSAGGGKASGGEADKAAAAEQEKQKQQQQKKNQPKGSADGGKDAGGGSGKDGVEGLESLSKTIPEFDMWDFLQVRACMRAYASACMHACVCTCVCACVRAYVCTCVLVVHCLHAPHLISHRRCLRTMR